MKVGDLIDWLQLYDNDDSVEIEVYDSKTDKYIKTDENPTIDKEGFDVVLKAKVPVKEIR